MPDIQEGQHSFASHSVFFSESVALHRDGEEMGRQGLVERSRTRSAPTMRSGKGKSGGNVKLAISMAARHSMVERE